MKYYIYQPYEDARTVIVIEASDPKRAAHKLVMTYAKEAKMSIEDIRAETEEVHRTHIFVPEHEVQFIDTDSSHDSDLAAIQIENIDINL